MSTPSAKELSKAVNREAVRQFPGVAKLLGMNRVVATLATRAALRMESPYPYAFTPDDSFYPATEKGFGRIISCGRKEGLQEIHSTISEQAKEHKWLYIPEKTMWLDTTLVAGEADVESDQYAHIFLSHMFPEIENVHTHPDKTIQMLSHEEPWNYSENYLLEGAQPSGSDTAGHYQIEVRTSAASRQVSSVVSHYGVTSFENDGRRRNGFRTERYDRLITDASDPAFAIRSVLHTMSQNLLNNDDRPALSFAFEPL